MEDFCGEKIGKFREIMKRNHFCKKLQKIQRNFEYYLRKFEMKF